jgi:hypothetical protein
MRVDTLAQDERAGLFGAAAVRGAVWRSGSPAVHVGDNVNQRSAHDEEHRGVPHSAAKALRSTQRDLIEVSKENFASS